MRLDFASRLLGRGRKVIRRLAGLDWPMPCFFVVLEKECKPLRKRLQALGGTLLP